jgi:hypothetical protein
VQADSEDPIVRNAARLLAEGRAEAHEELSSEYVIRVRDLGTGFDYDLDREAFERALAREQSESHIHVDDG